MTEHTTAAATGPHAIEPLAEALGKAATAAAQAPSIYNTQPWKWRIGDGAMELRADPDRRLVAADLEGRMLVVSCGVALHHAVIALTAFGYASTTSYLPSAADPDLLARVLPAGQRPPTARDSRRYQALSRRRTDRRPFGDEPVPAESIEVLRAEAEALGEHLHTVRPDQLAAFQVAAADAASIEITDPAYRAELSAWTHRPAAAGDGVPAETTVPASPRRVPLRAFELDGSDALPPGGAHDRGTSYLVLWGDNDGRRAWLHAGEALSAVLLAATELGLAASPMSDIVEVSSSRVALRRLLHWLGHPHMVVRIGLPTTTQPVPATPRRSHDETILVEGDPGGGASRE